MNQKIYKIATLLIFIPALFTINSCKKQGKFFTKDINIDPNQVQVARPDVLLAPAELALAYTQAGDLGRYTGVFTQQYTGAYRQFASYNNYVFNSADFGNQWNTLYTTCMGNLNQIIKISDEKGYNNYKGVAQILMAYSITLTSDMWGNVPYSQAFKGLDNLQPIYDNQKDIYTAALKLCDDGILNVTKTGTSGGSITPGTDDLIYSGDMVAWEALAHAIKARLYLHQSKFKPSSITDGLSEVALAINLSNASISFASASYGNPWYQYQSERGDIAFLGSNAYTMMITKNDPRIDALIDTSSIDGVPYDRPGYYLADFINDDGTAPVHIFTVAELKFIEAELEERNNNSLNAATAYNAAITESFGLMAHTADVTNYLTAHPYPTTQQIQAIIEEKYIALYGNPEVFTDWRRTGFPTLIPTKGAELPRRFLYPDSEEQYNNQNMLKGTSNTLYSKIWWDQ
jgi:hypothetical protein